MIPLIEKYIKYLRYEKNYSLHTEISYSEDLRQFSEFLFLHFPEHKLENVDGDIIRLWIVSLMEAKFSPRTVNRKLSTLKSFYKYLLRVEQVAVDPVKRILGPKTSKPIPSFANDSDMDMILDSSQLDPDFETLRDHLIVELFYVTGVRRAELIGLRNIDVDLNLKAILVTGKRNKQRLIPFADNLKSLIEKYTVVRDAEVGSSSGFFFVKKDGEKMYPMLVHRIVTQKMEQIPTLSKTSPHVLRHSFATGMLNNGADINAVKELLGHSSLAATEIYTHTSFEELKKIYNKAHPRA